MTGGVVTRGSEELLIPTDYCVPTMMDAHEAHHHLNRSKNSLAQANSSQHIPGDHQCAVQLLFFTS